MKTLSLDRELQPRPQRSKWGKSSLDYLFKHHTSYTTTDTAKNVVIVHKHYNFFSHLQRFFQQFYIWTTIFTIGFFTVFEVFCWQKA